MKKQIILVLAVLLIFIIGLFGLWQFNLYQRFSKETLSCGGDWSYNIQCPIGSYCQSLRQGPLVGGLCKPFFLSLFDIFKKFEKATKQPTTEKIISSEITVEECKIKVNTTKGEVFLNTNFGPQTKCYQFVLNRVSPSGKYVVFQDISGEGDSLLKVYSIKHDDTLRLDVLGTSNIFDISFLPDDRLVALYGYKGISKEKYLKMFDLSGLFTSYPSNIDKQYKCFINLIPYSKNITLPNIGKDYFSLSASGSKLRIYGTGGVNAGILEEYNFNELSTPAQ